jgi:hypothetical protein
VAVILSPLYVIHQLSALTSTDLGTVLLTFLYAVLLDYLVFRPLALLVYSLISTRIALAKRGYQVLQVPTSQPQVPEDQLNLLGEFYDDYDQGLMMTAPEEGPSSQPLITGEYDMHTPHMI